MGVPHRIKFDIAIPMNDGNAGDFGLTVNLFEIHPQGMKKTEMVRSHGGTARVCSVLIGKAPNGP